MDNDEVVDPWINFGAFREEESSMNVENDLTSYFSDKDVVNEDPQLQKLLFSMDLSIDFFQF